MNILCYLIIKTIDIVVWQDSSRTVLGQFPDKQFPEDICPMDICPTDNSPNNISMNGHFPETHFFINLKKQAPKFHTHP